MNLRRGAVVVSMACILAGCGSEADSGIAQDEASDSMGMSPEKAAFVGSCNEARGALYRVGQMAKGAQPIHVSDLSHGAGSMRMLAENRKASVDIFRRIDEWHAAVVARSQEITSLPPRVESGRVIEPDTTDMDRRMFGRIEPQGVALTPWVREVCGDLEDPFA